MGNGNEIKGRKMLDEKEWSNCIGCFFYCSTLVFVLSRLVVVQIAMGMLNENSSVVPFKCLPFSVCVLTRLDHAVEIAGN